MNLSKGDVIRVKGVKFNLNLNKAGKIKNSHLIQNQLKQKKKCLLRDKINTVD